MEENSSVWNKVLGQALKLPYVKVERDEFLKRELTGCGCSNAQIEKAVSLGTTNHILKDKIDKLAQSCINNHTLKVTLISTAAGVPGGFAMAATIPADTAQYFYHILVVAQKLAYLYGFQDLTDENGNLTETSTNMLTIFVGVMFGVEAANAAIREVAQLLAKQAVKKLPQMALSKTATYAAAKQVARVLGVQLTKGTFAKSIGKVILFVGAVVSGGLTYATFRPQAKRLQRKLQQIQKW